MIATTTTSAAICPLFISILTLLSQILVNNVIFENIQQNGTQERLS